MSCKTPVSSFLGLLLLLLPLCKGDTRDKKKKMNKNHSNLRLAPTDLLYKPVFLTITDNCGVVPSFYFYLPLLMPHYIDRFVKLFQIICSEITQMIIFYTLSINELRELVTQ